MKFLCLLSIAIGAHKANAHGYLSQPAAVFQGGSIVTNYAGILTESSDPAFAKLKWNASPETNTATFTNAFPNARYSTLRDLLDTVASDCGNSVANGSNGSPVDVSSLNSMKWQNDQEQKGFIDSHHGPCEAWIDSRNGAKTRVFHSDDCRRDYAGYPAEIPIDYASCSGDCTFIFYWLALHEPNWQVYKQCAAIVNDIDVNSLAVMGTATPPRAMNAVSEEPGATQGVSATFSVVSTTDVSLVAPEDAIFTESARCSRRRRLTSNLRSES